MKVSIATQNILLRIYLSDSDLNVDRDLGMGSMRTFLRNTKKVEKMVKHVIKGTEQIKNLLPIFCHP